VRSRKPSCASSAADAINCVLARFPEAVRGWLSRLPRLFGDARSLTFLIGFFRGGMRGILGFRVILSHGPEQ
jgi:hypothetical protein